MELLQTAQIHCIDLSILAESIAWLVALTLVMALVIYLAEFDNSMS